MNTRHKKPGRSEFSIEPGKSAANDTCKSTPKTAEVFVADNFLRLVAAFVVTRVFLFSCGLPGQGSSFFALAGRSPAHRAWLACCCAGSRSPGGAVAPPAL